MSREGRRSRRRWLTQCGGIGLIGTAGCLRLAENSEGTQEEDSAGSPQTESTDETETPDPETFDIELDPVWSAPSGSLATAGGDFFFRSRFDVLERVRPDGQTVFESDIEEGYLLSSGGGHRDTLTVDASGVYVGARAREDELGGRVYAFDPEDGTQRWVNDEPADGLHTNIGATAKLDDLIVYASQASGSGSDQEPIVRGVDAETGEERWQIQLEDGFVNGLIANDDRLFVQQTFTLYIYELSTRELLDERRESTGFNRAVSVDDVLYVPGNTIRALTLPSADEHWATDTSYEVNTTPGVGESGVYVGTEAGYVLGYDRDTGDQLWEARVDGTVEHRPIVAEGCVWIANERGELTVFLEETGDRVYNEDIEPSFEFAILGRILKDSERETAFEITGI